jgi:hypothetical protein
LADALTFLAIAMVVSLALSSSLPHQAAHEEDLSDLASRAHRALLGCDVRLELNGTVLPPMSISALSIAFASCRSQELGDRVQEQALAILMAIIPASVSFEWMLDVDGTVLLSCGEDPGTTPSQYFSTIELSSMEKIACSLVLWI